LFLSKFLMPAGRWEEAERVWAKLIAARPQDPFLQRDMGNILLHQGRFAEALPWYQRARAMYPSLPDTTMFLRYFMEALERARRLPPPEYPGSQVIFSLPVWGKDYLELFLRFGLGALLHESNLPALAEWRRPVLRFYSDQGGASLLEQAPEIARLRRVARSRTDRGSGREIPRVGPAPRAGPGFVPPVRPDAVAGREAVS
jgi:tetratricopeptide (TPR) repeat protein